MSNTRNGDFDKTALVTGGAGFIGSHVSDALLAQGWQVHVLDNLSAGVQENVHPDAIFHAGDVRSQADLGDALRAADYDAIIHCAAQTSVHRSMIEPDLDFAVNVSGTKRLMSMAKRQGVRRFVFMSSGGAIYGETASPAAERTLPAPRSFYGLHKYAAEQIVRTDGVPYVILRPSNVYGPRQRADAEGGVVAIFMARLLMGKAIEIHGNGEQARDFLHVSDVVSAALLAVEAGADAVWNVASGRPVSILELAQAIAATTQQPLRFDFKPRRPGDVDRSVLDTSTLTLTGRWGPSLSLGDGLSLTLADTARRIAHRTRESAAAAAGS